MSWSDDEDLCVWSAGEGGCVAGIGRGDREVTDSWGMGRAVRQERKWSYL